MKKIIALLLLLALCCGVTAQNWDINTLKKINRLDGRFTTEYSRVVAGTTPYLVVGIPAVMGIYALIDNNQPLLKDAIYIGTSVIEAAAITHGLKNAFDRRRPFVKYPDLIDARDSEDTPSFPSNHTASAFALATSLSITYPKWYVIAPSALWACSVGFSRMNQGVHYPSDVLAGALLGSGCAVANVYVNRWLNKWLFPVGAKRKMIIY